MPVSRFLICLLLAVSLHHFVSGQSVVHNDPKHTKAERYDRDYTLQATMLVYFGEDGTRNPLL